jgi:hypothetical protein
MNPYDGIYGSLLTNVTWSMTDDQYINRIKKILLVLKPTF